MIVRHEEHVKDIIEKREYYTFLTSDGLLTSIPKDRVISITLSTGGMLHFTTSDQRKYAVKLSPESISRDVLMELFTSLPGLNDDYSRILSKYFEEYEKASMREDGSGGE